MTSTGSEPEDQPGGAPGAVGVRRERAAPAASDGQRPLASVVIVNYNGLRYLDDCLTAVLAQELPHKARFEVIVVDNGSTDGSAEKVRTGFPGVELVEAGANLGFAGGNNLGMDRAQGEFVVLLNNDTRVRPGWLGHLVEAALEEPRAGAVTAKLVFMEPPGTIQNAGCLLLSDGSGADRGFHEADQGQYDRREEVFGACGASVLYRREMLEDVGAFDETFFMYYEDTDLNWRMRLAGWNVVYEPKAVVEHVHAGTSGEWSPFFTFHVDRNRLFMIIKNARPGFVLGAFSSFALVALRNALRAVLSRISRPPAQLGPNLGAGRARVHLRVLGSLVRHLPEMLSKRRQVRGHRRVQDAEIERWLFPRELWHSR